MKRVVVIGGGITGLAAAHRLAEHNKDGAGLEVTLLEASGRLGGVIQTGHRDGFLIERGPDSFLSEKPETIVLAKRLGMEPHLVETNKSHRRSFIVRQGKLRPVPEGFHLLAPARLWPFVTSDIFSWSGKARMALDLFLPRVADNGADESLAQFVRRRLGREALERMAQPMVGGIYTADPEKLSLRATMPRFLELERTHRSLIRGMRKRALKEQDATATASGARYSLFLSFDSGMQLLVDRLAAALPPETVRLNAKVETLSYELDSAQWLIKPVSGETLRADGVCLALPSYATANLLRQTDSDLSTDLDAIPYASTATINLAYRRDDIPHQLDGFGFVVPFIEKRSLIACTFCSVKFPDRAPDGLALLRVFVGGALQPEMFALDESEMVRRVRVDLEELLGITKSPLLTEVARWPRSMPQYHVGHLELVERIREQVRQLPNLSVASNAFSGAGISDCIRAGEAASDEILAIR
ncbi:MAG: protoporphyrinogen oxidase [Acidobacteriota bacterium]